jgi:GR25 family glycosyltransferase involved in LPS biosynthesis
MIQKQFVINLKIRPDRLAKFFSFLPENFGEVEVFSAVHGDSCRHPSWWNAGSGAWGCYRSHLQILERAMTEGYQNYMVLEDDSTFDPDFNEKYSKFLNDLPPDWDMFYLGGQLMHVEHDHAIPEKVTDNVFRPYNVNRTHCFAVNNKGYKYLYDFLLRRFENRTWHIDHHLGRLHEQKEFNVYCPPEWIVGQGESSSNIDGQVHEERFFPHPITYYRTPSIARHNYCIVLKAKPHIAMELQRIHDWHHGNDCDEQFVDKGLYALNMYPAIKLRQWWYYIKQESISKSKVPFLWHPSYEFQLSDLPFHPIHIQAHSVDEALSKLKSVTDSQNILV